MSSVIPPILKVSVPANVDVIRSTAFQYIVAAVPSGRSKEHTCRLKSMTSSPKTSGDLTGLGCTGSRVGFHSPSKTEASTCSVR